MEYSDLMQMTIIISCDNCNTVLSYENWQHRINGKIYCDTCFMINNPLRKVKQ